MYRTFIVGNKKKTWIPIAVLTDDVERGWDGDNANEIVRALAADNSGTMCLFRSLEKTNPSQSLNSLTNMFFSNYSENCIDITYQILFSIIYYLLFFYNLHWHIINNVLFSTD